MNKAQASAINADIKAALDKIFAKHGLEKGKQLAEATMEVVAAVRRPDASEPPTDA